MSVLLPELANHTHPSDQDRLLQAQAVVRSYCGWHIAPLREDVELTLDGTGTQVLLLPTMHLVEVASVTDDGNAVDLADIQWWANGVVFNATRWTCERGAITINITHGYDPVPPDVQAVVQALATRAVANTQGLTSKTVGPFSETYAQPATGQVLLDAERAVLSRYRLPTVA